MDTAQLAYPQSGFGNIPNRLGLSYGTVNLITCFLAWPRTSAADPEHVCAACGHEMEQFKAGRLDCVCCGVHIDLGE